jgi:homoserine dehydrogenase
MSMKKTINVGIIGFGTVGTGTARILIENADIIRRRLGAPVVLKKISDLDIKRDRGIKIGGVQLTTNVQDILGDPADTNRPRSSFSRRSRTKSTS